MPPDLAVAVIFLVGISNAVVGLCRALCGIQAGYVVAIPFGALPHEKPARP